MKRLQLLALAALVALLAAPRASADDTERSPVKVERVKRNKPKKPTLRFLRQNLDFLRSQLDWLEEVPRSSGDDALSLDERWLHYRELMASATTSRDSVEAARLAQERVDFLESVAELAGLEERLDAMAGLLDEQETRLAWLDEDFTGRQETALIVLLDDMPVNDVPVAVRLTDENGDARTIDLSGPRAELFADGGVVQLTHEFVEPREQVWEIAFLDERDVASAPYYVTFQPTRDRLSFLELSLAGDAPGAVDGLSAGLWVHGEQVNTDEWRWASR